MQWWTYQQLRANNANTRLAVVEKLAQSDSADSVGPLLFAIKDDESACVAPPHGRWDIFKTGARWNH